jgi:hypothetical protein
VPHAFLKLNSPDSSLMHCTCRSISAFGGKGCRRFPARPAD